MMGEANDVLFRRDFFIDMIMDIMVLKPLSESRGWGGVVKQWYNLNTTNNL